jgi:hypothetical protein
MFLAPALFAGLLAIALPVWLHRVARANPTRYPFASLMLLESTETQRTAKRTLRYWLLLALRIALLLALVFAFAGPLIFPRAVPSINPNARLHAIVLDGSLSMQYSDRWSRALQQVDSIAAAAHSGDQLMLVMGKGRQIEVLQDVTNATDAGSLRAALRQVKPGIGRLDYGLLMMTAGSWLGTRHLPVEMHVITDLQQSASPLRFADLEPPAGVQVKLHDVSHNVDRGDSANTFIKNATLVAADAGTLAVDIEALSSRPEIRDVVVSVDGREVERRRVELKPVSQSVVPEGEGNPPANLILPQDAIETAPAAHERLIFSALQLAAGAHRIEAALQPQDALPQDDHFYAVVEHANPRVLLVARTTDADDTAYVAAAVGALTAPQLIVEQHTAQAIEDRTLGNYSTLMVTDVATLSSTAASRIGDYVTAGGTLLVTLGPGAASHTDGLLKGLRIRDVQAQPTRVGRIDSSHPVLRNAEGWQDVRFFRHMKVEPAVDDKVLIALLDGSPLLIERAVGAGRMLLLTSPLEREWNDFATHPLFVRFIGEAARYLSGAGVSAASSQVGSVVMTGLTAASGGQIFDPQERRVLNLNETASAERLIPDQAGFYEVRNGAGVRWLAVNVDPRESDLTPMSSQTLQRWRGLQAAQPAVANAAAKSNAQAAQSPSTAAVSLGYWLLVLAAALLVTEILMANHYLAVRREVPR